MQRRFTTKKLWLGLLGTLVVALGVLVSIRERSGVTGAGVEGPASPAVAAAFVDDGLGGRTEQEIGQYAVNWVRAQGLAMPGSNADVVLVRSITRDEFDPGGIPVVSLPEPEPPLALVILRGRFVVRESLDQSMMLPVATSFLLVIELEEGRPVLYMSATRGGSFRELPFCGEAEPYPTSTIRHMASCWPLPRTPPEAETWRGVTAPGP